MFRSLETICSNYQKKNLIAKLFFQVSLVVSLLTISSFATHTNDHYAENTVNYEAVFFYSPGEYTTYLSALVQNKLKIYPHDEDCSSGKKKRILDLGGGTGVFTRMLLENTNMEAVVVDPFLPSTDNCNTLTEPDFDQNHIQYVSAGAEAFMNLTLFPQVTEPFWWQQNYDQVLLKEVVHHFNAKDRVPIFKALYKGFHIDRDSSIPSLLIITRPQYDIDYPLWPQARAVWAANQPSLEDLVTDLEAAGFHSIDSSIEAYACQVDMKIWLQMVRSRFWSTFSHFSDEEIEVGCHWLETHHHHQQHHQEEGQQIHFEDRLLFIRAFV